MKLEVRSENQWKLERTGTYEELLEIGNSMFDLLSLENIKYNRDRSHLYRLKGIPKIQSADALRIVSDETVLWSRFF